MNVDVGWIVLFLLVTMFVSILMVGWNRKKQILKDEWFRERIIQDNAPRVMNQKKKPYDWEEDRDYQHLYERSKSQRRSRSRQ